MWSLTKPRETTEAKSIQSEKLEDILMELLKYGQPKVGVYGSDMTWACSIDMNTNTTGSDFKIRSDWDHKTPLEAAKLCRDRVITAVAVYKAVA